MCQYLPQWNAGSSDTAMDAVLRLLSAGIRHFTALVAGMSALRLRTLPCMHSWRSCLVTSFMRSGLFFAVRNGITASPVQSGRLDCRGREGWLLDGVAARRAKD